MQFTKDFFKNNRKNLRRLIKSDAPIIIAANGRLQRNSDVEFPFRQDSSFWYLTGVNEADVVAVIGPEDEYLILPKREKHHDVFDGKVSVQELSKATGFSKFFDEEAGWEKLKIELEGVKEVATLKPPESYIDFYGFYTNPGRDRLHQDLTDLKPSLKVIDLKPFVTKMRMIKQEPEIAAIQKAITITTATLKDIKKKIASYKYEYEIEADLAHGFRKRGATGQGFPSIVAGGVNACTIHYLDNNAALAKANFVLLDVSAEINNYAADISVTYWRKSQTAREKEVYAAVKEAQEHAFSLLKPGVVYRDYEKQMEKFMGKQLNKLGVINTNKKEDIRKYFPHRTSHQLGLDVHDVEDYDAKIQTNMVLAVEPGIYIPEESIAVRIEDNVLITKTGCKVLSR